MPKILLKARRGQIAKAQNIAEGKARADCQSAAQGTRHDAKGLQKAPEKS